MSTEENKAFYRRWVEEGLNKRDLSRFDEFFDPGIVDHGLPPGIPPNREGVIQFLATQFNAFPDLRVTIDDMMAEGDQVWARITARGSQEGELPGIPPTHKQFTLMAVDMVRFANGKVVEHWAVSDQLSLMQQLGVIPTPGQSGS